eukprot:4243260-Alexandrium_andersonii.AAC.1
MPAWSQRWRVFPHMKLPTDALNRSALFWLRLNCMTPLCTDAVARHAPPERAWEGKLEGRRRWAASEAAEGPTS